MWRVVFEEGYGWPECERRERTTRKFDNARDAGRMVRTIRGLPSHHLLVGVFEARTEWLEVDPDLLVQLVDDDDERRLRDGTDEG